MALSEIDRNLLERCLQKKPQAWENFTDRFLGLVSHVVRRTCETRHIPLREEVCQDLVQEVFIAILADNFVILRRFRGNSSLATYLTVVARRIVVKSLFQKNLLPENTLDLTQTVAEKEEEEEKRLENLDEIEHFLAQLSDRESSIVRLYHLEQKSYAEIAAIMGIPENSVGPTLSRAREAMRRLAEKAEKPEKPGDAS
ncbi:MAG: RNA polymerase sigma factor [Planctomycetia bacterium]|nr:RNA polymerase sigma factor [Planctomycetia bacterium]